MSYELLSDDEIIHDLGRKLDIMRRYKEMTDDELLKKSGANRDSLDRFRNAKSGISLKNFIRLIRGVGELQKLEGLLALQNEYSPTGKMSTTLPKKIYKKKSKETKFVWGDDL